MGLSGRIHGVQSNPVSLDETNMAIVV